MFYFNLDYYVIPIPFTQSIPKSTLNLIQGTTLVNDVFKLAAVRDHC